LEKGSASWHTPLFHFARFIKAHPVVAELSSDEAAERVEEVLRGWEEFPSTKNLWNSYFPEAESGEEPRLDFMVSFMKVLHVPFTDITANALRLAEETPLKPPNERGPLYQRFISLAGWLQVLMKEKVIILPTHKLGVLLHCNPRTVSRLRTLAASDGLLELVKEHQFRSAGGKNEASEFRFKSEYFQELSGK
jgi:hypothetical protein